MAASRSIDEKHFLDEFREALIQQISMVAPVLDRLLQENHLTTEQYDNVRHKRTNQEKMRALYRFIRGWSNVDKDIVYDALKEYNPRVIENLEGRQSRRTRGSRASGRQSRTTRGRRLSDLRRQHMESVKMHFLRIKEHNARGGETVSLQERYTPLIMRKGYPKREVKEQEILNIGSRHTEAMEGRSSDDYSPITLNALFDPEEDGFIPMVVVLHGAAGVGKTWTSRKIMLDWASGDFYRDKFDFVFYLSCRELNTITGEISLVRLLSRSSSLSSGDLVSILSDPGNHGRLLFVIDGFDEFRWGEEEAETCEDFSEETHKETLLGSLLRKHLLNPSSLLITTRSLAQEKLSTFIHVSRDIEVKGFSEEDRMKYFINSFSNETEGETMFSVIRENNLLLTMCSVPILCWIVCTVLRQEIMEGPDVLQYKTTTPIYLLYLQGLIIYHGRKKPVLPCLKKLCALANEGILDQKILFKDEDLKRHGLSVSEVESVFLNENIFQVSITNQTCYSFIHLSMQEFLAAVHYVLDDGDEGERRGEASLPEICKGGSLPKMCYDHFHLAMAVRFLFGLLYEKRRHEFTERTGIQISLRVRPAVEEWLTRDSARSALKERLEVGFSSVRSIDSISCLYETQDEDLIRRAFPRSTSLKLSGFWYYAINHTNEVNQLCYCLKLSGCPLILYVEMFTMTSEYLEISALLHICQTLEFQDAFFPQIGSPGHSFEQPSDLSWLINPQSKIQNLRFENCHLTPSCCDQLYSTLITNQSLTKLDLLRNQLEDSGVMRLCEGLRDPRCVLQELSLIECNLSPLSCEYLFSTLMTSQSLTELDLSFNNLKDSGVKRLCEGIRDRRCTLKQLSLWKCGATLSCCDDLCSALTANRTLKYLGISLKRNGEMSEAEVSRKCEELRRLCCTVRDFDENTIEVECKRSFWLLKLRQMFDPR